MPEVNPRIICNVWNIILNCATVVILRLLIVKEAECIQDHLQSTIHSGLKSKLNNVARKFYQLMTLRKATAALKLLSTDTKVFCHLIKKYPLDRMVMVILFGNQ